MTPQEAYRRGQEDMKRRIAARWGRVWYVGRFAAEVAGGLNPKYYYTNKVHRGRFDVQVRAIRLRDLPP